jgi:GntR family transcriptional regulator/MocR family aminotransferase
VDLHVGLDGRRDLGGQIYAQVRAAILDGRLRPGDDLPPTRELATRLAVSRNTVSAAYERLAAEGFVSGRVGVGTYVSAQLPAVARRPDADRSPADDPVRPRAVWDTMSDPPDLSLGEPAFDFRTGLPDARYFPFATWRGLVSAELRGAGQRHTYGEPAGHPALRAAIARHVAVSRAVLAGPADVFVTNGIQQAIDLLGRVLIEPGDVVAMEDPGYPPPKRLFRSLGARVVGVPVDADGLVVDALPDDVRLVYVTPSHQFPLGAAMPLARRLSLLAWARRTGAVILEDDYDSEFRWTGRPVEPLQSLDRAGRVVYVGSFSKTMLPTLRLGFCVAPASLHTALRKAKYVADWQSGQPMQAALARFIDDGLLARHLRRMRRVYRARRDRIAMALDGQLAGVLEPVSAAAGLHLTAWLREGDPGADEEVERRAAAAGVAVYPLSMFAVDRPARPGLVLGYGMIEVDRIDEGLRRLHACLGRAGTVTGT